MTSASATPAVAVGPPADDDEEIDVGEAELASRLRLAVTRLHRRLRQQAVGGLSPAQISALASTERLESATLGELASHESVQPPSMTRIIAALEEKGLVTRVIDPTDRRVARIEVTPEGRQVLAESRSRKNVYLARQLHRLTPAERDALGGLTAVLERLAEGLEP
ncbi:MAG TPA: MarR family transcriptional regulator [Acidimicrobiales bacterium]|jgi:DNA-binding MarR family transcriptional regulator|nr:MarR family transcriptional regulator [Acidimicrobiales bacterium]